MTCQLEPERSDRSRSKPVEANKKPKNENFIITNRKKFILSVSVIGMLLIGGLILLILFLASKHKVFYENLTICPIKIIFLISKLKLVV